MLSACGGSAVKFDPPPLADETTARIIPKLDPRDAAPVADPGVPVGESALGNIADLRVAFGECRRRHARVVDQFRGVESLFLLPPKKGSTNGS